MQRAHLWRRPREWASSRLKVSQKGSGPPTPGIGGQDVSTPPEFLRHKQDGASRWDPRLAGHRQRGELLLVVLHLQRGAIGHERAVRQTDAQGGADVGALNRKRLVVLPLYVTSQHQFVFQNGKRAARNHVNCKQTIGHGHLLRS